MPMRFLVACPDCKRQYDAGDMEIGSIFHCLCGARITVPRPKARNAAVVRCAWCGAPRQEGAKKCEFCKADFTLHEKDMHTICSSCMARVSDKARFCHHCGTPIVPEQEATRATEYGCPVCGEEKKLRSRKLEGGDVAVLECMVCGGLWMGSETFQAVLEGARKSALPPKSEGGIQSAPPDYRQGSQAPQQGPLYRKCVVCAKLMNRINYGRSSGVIIDLCKGHGVWFDADELERLVKWIRQGGLAQADERRQIELKTERQLAAMDQKFHAMKDYEDMGSRGQGGIFGVLADMITQIIIR
jgi:Zn-finger nucleic acid-binding protein